ncbi:MAG TPA: acetate/propionate family kinase [Candidatus Dormibacteraeota bacterium]|nr:acetate/propionate family kinase [Candidatus Dormibacteraeota bacterium]
MQVLIVNAGSSSLKLRLLDGQDQLLVDRELVPSGGKFDPDQVRAVLTEMPGIEAIGHRVVHGGEHFSEAIRIDTSVEAALELLTELAPLHQPAALAAIRLVGELLPATRSVACFDTAFHSTLPAAASTLAIPSQWREMGARRYGFHGLSHAYASRRATEMLGLKRAWGLSPRLVTCHLGAGASLAAVAGGRSLDTTMGFTPLDGLVMATRSGSVDPGLILWLIQAQGIGPGVVREQLEHNSGLKGLAGTEDMAQLLEWVSALDPSAQLAQEVYLHRLVAQIAAMAAAMGGLDGLVFTGGVGENAPAIRAAAASKLNFLGVEIDLNANNNVKPDAEITAPRASVRTLIVHAREDLEIARQVRELLEN